MHYEMEELIPIVGRLAEKYTANESTSVTYEKAEQLMGAVLYCIHEAERQGPQEGDASGNLEGASDRHPLIVTEKKLSAKQAYEAGAACVEQKTRKALKLYHEILPEFQSYENECLYDTFVKGLPEFFKWYDVKFQPQNTILTMDYPVLKDISGLSGIDKVYAFIKCIRLEQRFLKKFPRSYVAEILEQYARGIIRNMESGGTDSEMGGAHSAEGDQDSSEAPHVDENDAFYEYSRKDIMENRCEIVFISVILHILVRKPLSEPIFLESEHALLEEMCFQKELPEIRERLRDAAEVLFEQYDNEDAEDKEITKKLRTGRELSEYLSGAIDGLAARLKTAADCGTIRNLI